MRVLLDENISDDLKKIFLSSGIDVLDLKEKGLRQTPDRKVVHLAIESQRVIITHDKDFLPFMIDPTGKVKILLLSIHPQTYERTFAVGKFIVATGVLQKLKKSAIVHYVADMINISNA